MSSKILSDCMNRLISVVGFSDCDHLDDFVLFEYNNFSGLRRNDPRA